MVIVMKFVKITNLKLQKMDSNHAKCLDTRRSMTGHVVYLNGASAMFRSSTQKMVSLLTNKTELNATVMSMQDALFTKYTEIIQAESQVTYVG